MLADTGLQGLFQHDATVSTAGVITELTATKVMLTARSFTQALIITAFKSTHADKQNLLLHPMPHPPLPSLLNLLCLLLSSPKVYDLI